MVCRIAQEERIMTNLHEGQHFVDTAHMFTMQDLLDIHSGVLTEYLSSKLTFYSKITPPAVFSAWLRVLSVRSVWIGAPIRTPSSHSTSWLMSVWTVKMCITATVSDLARCVRDVPVKKRKKEIFALSLPVVLIDSAKDKKYNSLL